MIVVAQQTASAVIQHQLKEVLRLNINIHMQTVEDDRCVDALLPSLAYTQRARLTLISAGLAPHQRH